MILESFEIENWSCIGRIAVDDLPPTGVVVLHGPNGTGKSSIFAALRAALLDFPSTSRDRRLMRYFPKSGEPRPHVRIAFRTGSATYRIAKKFGTKDSLLESRQPDGSWKAEASSAADSHEGVRRLLGGKDSDLGLGQLLWLPQAEIGLPGWNRSRMFSANSESRLCDR